MAHPSAPLAIPPAARVHLVLYDGLCGLCNRLVQFLLRHDHRAILRFTPLQSETGRSIVARSGGDPDDLTTFYLVADYATSSARVLTKSDAALFVARTLGWPWRTANWLRVLPRSIRDRAYDLVARSRYQWFGRSDTCQIPTPESRSRFID